MKARHAMLVAIFGVAVFTSLGHTAQSQSAYPALSARSSVPAQASSRIAFISEPPSGGYCGVVYVMNADGSGQRRLVGGTESCAQETAPAWSPDGRRIAIVSNSKIYVMNADGSTQRRLTRGTGFEDRPGWSPDGRKIAFLRGGEILVVNADGSGERELTRNAGVNPVHAPAWSPDGSKILFVGRTDRGPLGASNRSEVYVVNADGSGQRRLARITGGYFAPPAWSPDGRKIVFERNWQVWVMNADGSGQRRLTLKGARNFNPAWSPDGRRIAFERGKRQRYTYHPGRPNFEVYVMNADGSGQQRLTRGGSQPRWSPDGRKIAFASMGRDGDNDIWIMNADGSSRRNLTRAAGRRESGPVWSPAPK